DSELVAGILDKEGYRIIDDEENADVILVNTCTVRQHADQRALSIVSQLLARKKKNEGLKIGLLGCLAERLGDEAEKLLSGIDLVLGPDSYRDIASMLKNLPEKPYVPPVNTVEDYDNIPALTRKGQAAFLAISRGCDNSCSYCIVPYVRGKERSRPAESILNEIRILVDEGLKEITLLGQNVNSYRSNGVDFPELLNMASGISGLKRIRFTTSHPKDLSEKLVHIIRDSENICSHIHLPVQSGSNNILKSMNREYTREHYLSLIKMIKENIPGISITTDIISGFPGETVEDHLLTVDLVGQVEYDSAFTFKYSPRDGTNASDLKDDVPDTEKVRRLNEISNLQRDITSRRNREHIGKEVDVLVESKSKRSPNDLLARTDTGKNVIITGCDLPVGSFCNVKITGTTSQTLIGKSNKMIE
ncbi:MAG: tRNA (N6-isopentenyl adenosine(37)-C2)-methylthiotransferase MiaB, partial [bacterium]|nr:tRNA (N6-isopentenyl adenosine(37)-C2)-methylthiotransferase MiaB [bacterium]